jgi:hypothetical protein
MPSIVIKKAGSLSRSLLRIQSPARLNPRRIRGTKS